jgi:hypothetical protein
MTQTPYDGKVMTTTAARRPGGVPGAVGLGVLCGIALPMGAATVGLLAGLFGALIADSLGLGGDSAVFGEGADAFVIAAFFGFIATYVGALILGSLAIRRSFGVNLIVPLIALLSPTILGLVLVSAVL